MTIGAMLSDIVRSLFKKPVTERYPFERKPTPARLRGKLIYDPTRCTGCMLCMKDCTANAIEIITVDKVNKKFVMRFHADRCTYCAQCVENCRFDCIQMSAEDYEMAALTRTPFEVMYGREEDLQALLDCAEKAPGDEPAA
jgi:formate hydrogenlyase subunit 6/NADH:ubiquinone oxidoreductase subunit I